MPAPIRLRLDQHTREAVARQHERAGSAIERTKCQMVLLADEGRSIIEIAWLVGRGREQVRKVLHRFRAEGVVGLAPRKHTVRPPEVTPAWLAELQRVIELDPHAVGVNSAVWTRRLLATYLAEVTGHGTGIEAVRVHLHRAGYVCKRPTWSLKRKATEPAMALLGHTVGWPAGDRCAHPHLLLCAADATLDAHAEDRAGGPGWSPLAAEPLMLTPGALIPRVASRLETGWPGHTRGAPVRARRPAAVRHPRRLPAQ